MINFLLQVHMNMSLGLTELFTRYYMHTDVSFKYSDILYYSLRVNTFRTAKSGSHDSLVPQAQCLLSIPEEWYH